MIPDTCIVWAIKAPDGTIYPCQRVREFAGLE
jgi:hypothetical protein